jgi:hypothetical protein
VGQSTMGGEVSLNLRQGFWPRRAQLTHTPKNQKQFKSQNHPLLNPHPCHLRPAADNAPSSHIHISLFASTCRHTPLPRGRSPATVARVTSARTTTTPVAKKATAFIPISSLARLPPPRRRGIWAWRYAGRGWFAVKPPIDVSQYGPRDSQYGPCNQSDTRG